MRLTFHANHRIALRRARRRGSACAIVALRWDSSTVLPGVGARHNQASPLGRPVAREQLAPCRIYIFSRRSGVARVGPGHRITVKLARVRKRSGAIFCEGQEQVLLLTREKKSHHADTPARNLLIARSNRTPFALPLTLLRKGSHIKSHLQQKKECPVVI